ncbi:MAG TPA: RDD family protein [Chloroflexia bacterium]|nr:RDD family protein [Chloroflexia bacterium]
MDEQLTISTPEQVAFEYEMAGIGSRFVAALLDHLILAVTLLLIVCAASTIGVMSLSARDGGAGAFLVLAIMTLITFLIIWGYFVVFETVWNGQTPGKRAGRLRVIRYNGQPIGAGEALVRNLVRLVDFMPGFYGVGLLSMFIDKNARRLGDFAAGTIVIREGVQTRLNDVRVNRPAPEQPSYAPAAAPSTPYSPYTSYSPYATGQIRNPKSEIQNRLDPLPGISIRDVTHQDYALMRELLARSGRGELPSHRTQDLAVRMAYGVAGRMGQNFAEWQARGWQPLVFLQAVLDAKDVRGE